MLSRQQFEDEYDVVCLAVRKIHDSRFFCAINGGAIQTHILDLDELLESAQTIVDALPDVIDALRRDESGELREAHWVK